MIENEPPPPSLSRTLRGLLQKQAHTPLPFYGYSGTVKRRGATRGYFCRALSQRHLLREAPHRTPPFAPLLHPLPSRRSVKSSCKGECSHLPDPPVNET